MGHVARFQARGDEVFARGDQVVVRSLRGMELGVVLLETQAPPIGGPGVPNDPLIERRADAEDLNAATRAERERDAHFELCREHALTAGWPIELVDAEPLLNERTVLLYLGPHRFDPTELLQSLQSVSDRTFILQPVGTDAPLVVDDVGCGSCHDHGCASGGGCGSSGACADCGIMQRLAAAR